MLQLTSSRLFLSLREPGDGFYCGTRFDRSGVFASLRFDGVEMAGPWFAKYDPYMHDAVQGPAEEFSPIWVSGGQSPSVGQATREIGFLSRCIKIGVGLLRLPDDQPYDRFRLYEIVDPGRWEAFTEGERIVFRHILDGWYEYEKQIVLTGETSFEIRHSLSSPGPELSGEVYNHNFFTFGKMAVGPSREIDFPFSPSGTWRSVYDSVAFTASGVRFSRALSEGESVYSGDIHAAGRSGMPYRITIRETAPLEGDGVFQTAAENYFSCSGSKNQFPSAGPSPLSVRIEGDVPVTHSVLWANHRIACLEPYNAFHAAPAAPFRWTIRYELF